MAKKRETPWADSIPEGASKKQIERLVRGAQGVAISSFTRDATHIIERRLTAAIREIRADLEKLMTDYVLKKIPNDDV